MAVLAALLVVMVVMVVLVVVVDFKVVTGIKVDWDMLVKGMAVGTEI